MVKRKVRRNVDGFMAGGKFHPIRKSKGYSTDAAGESFRGGRRKGKAKRKK